MSQRRRLELYAPLITPFQDDDLVDLRGFEQNLQRYDETSLDGYLINGSSAEAEMLDEDEQLELLKLACSRTKKAVIAGVATTSTKHALKRLEVLADLPLKAVLLRTPSYFGAQLEQVDYFLRLAEESPLPVMVYQIPQYTGVKLRGEQLAEMAAHPNLIGIKDSLGDLAMLGEQCWPEHFRYYLGAAALLQPGVAAGASGGILALANVVPELCRDLLEKSSDPRFQGEARELQRLLIPLARLLGGSRGYGLAGLKAACELRGLRAGHPRRPLRRANSEAIEVLRRELELLERLRPL